MADDQLSLAIGKRGQNVRLAARLTGWRTDIKSESRAASDEMLQYASFDAAEEARLLRKTLRKLKPAMILL